MFDGERYPIERYALSEHTDAARESLTSRPGRSWRVAGLGVTKAHEGFAALPAVKQELTGLVRSEGAQAAKRDAKGNAGGILPGIVKLDEAFNAESLRGALREHFAVVHIASHFKFDPAGEGASFLLLGDGKRLSLEALRKEGYRFADVDLLTLSACETAVGGVRDANGREIEGFGAMAQKQGAKGVMATLWPVADHSTGELMQRFYREREARQLSKAEALRQAQLALLRGEGVSKPSEAQVREEGKRLRPPGAYIPNLSAPYAHPYYWAPFVLMGNWL